MQIPLPLEMGKTGEQTVEFRILLPVEFKKRGVFCDKVAYEMFSSQRSAGHSAQGSFRGGTVVRYRGNRQEYLQLQKKEKERKAAIERENRRQKEIEMHRRLEEERRKKEAEEEKARLKRLEAYREQERLKPQKEAYNAENKKIMEIGILDKIVINGDSF